MDQKQEFYDTLFQSPVRGPPRLEGTQVIGWDPSIKSIKSWVFDSLGGFGQGVWSREGSRWTVRTTGVLITGEKTSAINIYTALDENTFTFSSIGREIERGTAAQYRRDQGRSQTNVPVEPVGPELEGLSMKNSAIYSMALVIRPGLYRCMSMSRLAVSGLESGFQQQQAPHVQQQQAPRVQQQQAPRVQQQQAPRCPAAGAAASDDRGSIAYSAPSMSRPSQVHVQSPPASRQLSRPSQAHVQSPQSSCRQVSRPSQVRVQSPQSSRQVSRPSQVQAQSLQKSVPIQSKPQVTKTSDIRNPARERPSGDDATHARPSAALPQSSQVFGGYKTGPWNNRSSPRAAQQPHWRWSVWPVQAPTEPAWPGPQLASDRQRTRVGPA